ncbi:MAG: rRNA pseudouridine synthase [Muribaculaceae bacterium]|nr:rRNA pseudouridine synthase [Muribaculaceae bacterium]
MSGDDHASTAEGQGDAASSASGYQPRQQGYQPYQRREGGYQPYQRREGGYQPRNNGYNRQNADQQGQGGYQPRQNHNGYGQPRQNQGYGNYNRQNNHNNGYGQQRQQGGYQPRQQGGYGQNQQGGYQPRQQGGYGQNQHGGYQPRQNQGGYQPRQQGGYGQRQQGGYQPRQNQGGYQQRQQGGYQPRQNQGGYQQRGQQRPNQRGGYNQNRMNQPSRTFTPRPRQIEYQIEEIDPNAEIRLNKYMANAGICSRREADEHITNGKVKVNGNVVTELGVKITPKDVVEFDDKVVTPERKCYVLLNKPKDCVTTSDDPNGRLTVLDLVKNACRERIYPVGRLDRNTTGVLLLTNDGDLASKLTHPKFVKKKIYHVWTDKEIAEEDMQRIADGIELEDGELHADAISYVADARNQAGIEIHSGRNRIVRRIFEHLGYRVTKLDRVYFAGLTKKNLPRGRWRYLTQEEVNFLRMGSFE